MSSLQLIDTLVVLRLKNRRELGKAAANAVSKRIKEIMKEKKEINMMFAAAPSQDEFLEYLVKSQEIDWNRINAFHMDEYIGLDSTSKHRFSNYLKKAIFERVPLKSVNYINTSSNPESECKRYSELLKAHPLDISCTGIGENGHLAFNDPHVADFNDSEFVKIVNLDERSRKQQVNDGCFDLLEEVPKKAITITIPIIMGSDYIACMVPGAAKAEAVKKMLIQEINETCPATILRKHKAATLYLDTDSAKYI